MQKTENNKTILIENTVEEYTLTGFEAYYKAIIIKTCGIIKISVSVVHTCKSQHSGG